MTENSGVYLTEELEFLDRELQEIRDLAGQCACLADELRREPLTAGTIKSEKFIDIWSGYHDLLQRMPVIIEDPLMPREKKAELRTEYRGYFKAFQAVKDDVTEVYNMSKDVGLMIPVGNTDEQSLSDLINDVRIYEEKNAELLSNSLLDDKTAKTFFKGLFTVLKKALNFVKMLFFNGETVEDYVFGVTPFVRLRWTAMLLADKDAGKEEACQLVLVEAKSRDLVRMLGSETLLAKNKKAAGEESAADKINLQNKFSNYIRNLADTLATREISSLNAAQFSKAMVVLEEDRDETLITKLKSSLPIMDDITKFGQKLPAQMALILAIVSNLIEGISVAEDLIDLVPINPYEFGLFAHFAKKFGLKLFLTECFSRLDKFNEFRRKGILRN